MMVPLTAPFTTLPPSLDKLDHHMMRDEMLAQQYAVSGLSACSHCASLAALS